MRNVRAVVGVALALVVVSAGAAVLFSDLLSPQGEATGVAPKSGIVDSQLEVQYVVNPGCTGTPATGTFCSLDEAVDKAVLQQKAVLVLSPGEHKLTRTIRKGITIRSKVATAGPAFADIVVCAVPFLPVGTPAVTIRTGGTLTDGSTGLTVELADEKDRVVLNGVRLLPAVGTGGISKKVLTVKKGHVSLESSVLAGRVVATGTGATLTAVNTSVLIPPGGVVKTAPVGGAASGPRYNEAPVSAGLCETTGEVGVAVLDGARLYSVGLDVSGEMRVGVCVSSGEAHLCEGSIHDTTFDYTANEAGWGAYVGDGGELDLKAVDVTDNGDIGVLAEGEGTSLVLREGTEVSETDMGGYELMAGIGVVVQDKAELTMQDASVVQVVGPGVLLSWGAQATVEDCLFHDDQYAAFVILGASLQLSGSSILGIASNSNMLGGWAMDVSNDPYGASTVSVDGCQIDGQGVTNSGILVTGTGVEPSTVTVTNSTMRGMVGEPYGTHTKMGSGFYAREVCQGITLQGNTYEDNVGPHIFLHGAAATVSGESIVSNKTFDVLQQNCTCSAAALDDASLQAGQVAPLVTRICDEDAYWEPYDDEHFTIFLELAEIEG